eukprot:s2639_g5.t1
MVHRPRRDGRFMLRSPMLSMLPWCPCDASNSAWRSLQVFLGVGLVAGEIFRYNRQNFAFDQDQRFRRPLSGKRDGRFQFLDVRCCELLRHYAGRGQGDELRLKMQVERFRLFRQDIRDLVELTVGKMDLYHMVGPSAAR